MSENQQKLDNLREEFYRNRREIEAKEDAIRLQAKQLVNDLEGLQQQTFHCLSGVASDDFELRRALNKVGCMAEQVQEEAQGERRRLKRELDDLEYDYQVQKRKLEG